MAPSKKEEEIETLKLSISYLSNLQPLSKTLSVALEKNFKPLNQCEACEVLRYLVNACMKEKRLKFVDEKLWKSLDKDSKMTVEKFKKDILDAIKHISMENKTYIPVIKKSELLLPYSPNVFKCFLGLSSYALSFQLSLMGIQFWPELEKPTRAEIISRTEEIMEMQKKQLELNKQIEMMRHGFNELEKKKLEIDQIVESVIHSSANVSADVLRDPKLRKEYIKNLSKEADDQHEKNKKRLEVLKRCDEHVDLLTKFVENDNGKIVIDGKDLIPLISYETQVFAEKEGIQLFENGSLCLQGLLRVIIRTLAQRQALPSNMSKILELKSKVDCCTGSMAKLEQMEKNLKAEISELRCKLERRVNVEEARAWEKKFFVPIPQLNFNRRCEPLTIRDPVIDLERLDKLIAREKPEKRQGCIPKLQAPRANSSVRGLRRRSISADRIGFPFSAKAESTRYLRDQQSFKNSKLSPKMGKSLLDISFRSTSVSKVTDESYLRDQQSFKNSKLSPRLGKSLLDMSFRSTSVSKVMDERGTGEILEKMPTTRSGRRTSSGVSVRGTRHDASLQTDEVVANTVRFADVGLAEFRSVVTPRPFVSGSWSIISSIENALSPTSRRIQEMNISGEQTISPIPHLSRKNSVVFFNEDFTHDMKPRDSDAASSLSFSSPFSLMESSMNDTRDTWDISSRDMPSLSGGSSSEEV